MFSIRCSVVLNYEEICKHVERIAKINPFTSKYKRKRTDFRPEKDNWKKFKKYNVIIALNVLYAKNK